MTVAHVAVNVSDWEAAKGVLRGSARAARVPRRVRGGGALAYFADRLGLDFGIGRRDPVGGAHVAFDCPDRETVDAFYANALGAGGRDNGPPGIREQYDANYYAAYVLDPDGNNIEAVCHHAPS